MAEKSGKRKRTVLSIEKKLQICKKLRNGATATDLSKEFEVGKSTIADIDYTNNLILWTPKSPISSDNRGFTVHIYLFFVLFNLSLIIVIFYLFKY